MKIKRLRAHAFRGIKDVDVLLSGESIAVLGPNGTGKSSIVDALDFLCTGQIRRLTGEGAKAISLGKHAPHIDESASDAWVEAEIISSGGQTIWIRRAIQDPDELAASSPLPPDLSNFLVHCKQGSHLLTRREILRYIVAEPSQRYQQISSLLQITEIDSVRKELQGAAKDAKDRHQQAVSVRGARLASVLRSFDPQADGPTEVPRLANAHRATLGAPAIDKIRAGLVLDGVTPPGLLKPSALQTQRARELLGQLREWFEKAEEVASSAANYARAVMALRSDTESMRTLELNELLRRAEPLVTEDRCPVCEQPQSAAELRAVISRRIEEGFEVRRYFESLEANRRELKESLTGCETTVRSLADAIREEFAEEANRLKEYANAMHFYSGVLLIDPASGELPDAETVNVGKGQIVAPAVAGLLSALTAKSEGLPDLEGIQKAWDELSGLDKALRELNEARSAVDIAEAAFNALASLETIFVEARDAVMEETYEAITERFAALYARIHRVDEGNFKAAFEPTKAGLKLEVDFYGRGTHAPNALHSEGHQDSMGLCLFLALAEQLAGGEMPIMILDDVVMSVDHGHRRAVAEVLRDFGKVQWLITTHDRVWYRQLQNLGAVNRQRSIEIRSWSLEDGPGLVEDAAAMLAGADQALGVGNVPAAAHQLRRAVEVHFREFCDSLGAPVRFRGDGAYQAGDFVVSANKRLSDLTKIARKAAESWGKDTHIVDALDARRAAAMKVFGEENWAINQVVHYNEWADLSIADFRPVLAAYKQLFALYLCQSCQTVLRIEESGATPTMLRCACGDVALTLTKRPVEASLA